MAYVKIEQLKKSFGSEAVLHGIDLEIKDGEFVVFVGPSGCGKSTLLRLIAGLETQNSGSISIGDRKVDDVAPSKRGVAMVFQTYALYPHMSVYKNMAFGLKQAKTAKKEIDSRVSQAAEILGLTELLGRSPRALSGGQRQRVAIGRAIVREPEVFLFDEPLSNLDAALRTQTRLEISRLHQRLNTTMIYVTHDQIEAMTLADRIVVLRGGRVEQTGTPLELYHTPENRFVAQFIGSPKMNFFEPDDLPETVRQRATGNSSSTMEIGMRPEHMLVTNSGEGIISGRLELTEQLGEYTLAHLITPSGKPFTAKTEHHLKLQLGDDMHFNIDDNRIHRFEKESGHRIEQS